MFDCIFSVHELGRHGWLCTYNIWVIRVCRTWLIVYLSDTIMRKWLIVYLPCMSLKDMVDGALTIYEWYEFVRHGWLYTYRIQLWGKFLIIYLPFMSSKDMVDCALTIYEWYEIVRHGWLYTYRIGLWRNFWLYTSSAWA